MASTAAVASSSTTLTRPQAGPIPSKRGEIGFVEGVHEQTQEPSQTVDLAPLPARHPADTSVPSPTVNAVPPQPDTPQTLSDDSSMTDVGKPPFFLGNKKCSKFIGVNSTTLVLLGSQILLFIGTVIGWVFAALALDSNTPNAPPPNPPGNGDNLPPSNPGASHIFIHVAFAVFALAQMVLIERRIFRVRAERFASKHPGEMLPTSLQRGGHSASASIPVAPWHRPPLPTYAAALASGAAGTGDVEDAEIAPPPPPAYGKTRGSTLLLAGFLRNSLRVQAREYEQDRRASGVSARSTTAVSDRPISFVSLDEEWEVRRDADRARRIEEALAALENSRPVMTGSSQQPE